MIGGFVVELNQGNNVTKTDLAGISGKIQITIMFGSKNVNVELILMYV